LVNLLERRLGGLWHQHFAPKGSSRAVALTIWLGFLGGYPSEKLTGLTNQDCKGWYSTIERKCIGYKVRRNELNSQLARLQLKGHSTEAVEQHLAELAEQILLKFDWRLLARLHAAEAPSTAPPPPPPPPPPLPPQSNELRTYARDVRWLIACGASSRCSPIHSLFGHSDVLVYICNLACKGGMALWMPCSRAQPQVETLRDKPKVTVSKSVMALTAEEHEASMECDEYVAASDAAGGKRPAEVPPPGEPAPTRSRPPDGPHEDSLGGAATHTLPTPHTTHPPEEDASAESLFGQSTHPSEGVTPHGPRTESATARKPAGKVKKMGWLTVSCPANTQGQLTFADVEDAISILLMDLTDESREGGAIDGVPTNPSLVDDSIQSGPYGWHVI